MEADAIPSQTNPHHSKVNARRARTYLKLLRWSGLRAGDAACLSRDKLRDDGSLFLYQKKVKGKASSAVYGLLPHDVAEELRNVRRNAYTATRQLTS